MNGRGAAWQAVPFLFIEIVLLLKRFAYPTLLVENILLKDGFSGKYFPFFLLHLPTTGKYSPNPSPRNHLFNDRPKKVDITKW